MLVLLMVLSLAAAPAWAGPGGADSTGAHRPGDVPTVRAAPAVGRIHIDGRLDEPDWAAATPVDRFIQRDPDEGQPVSERTEVRILIGSDALYIGARLSDRDAAKIRSRLVRRDDDLASDYFAVLIDSYLDHATGCVFRVAPSGSYDDAAIASNGNEDSSWDPVWSVRTSIDADGWTAEMEIPLSQLHYTPSRDAAWGIQLRRWIDRKQELAEFAFTPKDQQEGVAQFGRLVGLGHLAAPRRLEVLPYSLARADYRPIAAGDPFRDGSDHTGTLGGDAKLGLTSNLTLNATVNPDFGQVEVDPAVVNLSAYETFFPEKRPFFVEEADVFRFGQTRSNNNFNTTIAFHARRIGRAPQRSLEDSGYAYVDAPSQARIATALKLTGKTAAGWSVGVLDAVTSEERARYVDNRSAERQTPVEPLTNYFVGRLRRDYGGGVTSLGGIATSVVRDLRDPALGSMLRTRALAGGIDFNHFWDGRNWSFDGFLMGSRIGGSAAAIDLAQRSSARYYQRPDATHLHYDPARTALDGFAGLLSLNKIGGRHWLGCLTYQDWSPGFEINDVGFQNAADCRALSTLALYKEEKPGRLFRSYDVFAFSNHSINYGGDLTFAGYAAQAEATLRNYWSGSLRGTWYPGSFDDRLTRGGPMAQFPAGGNFTGTLASDSRKTYQVSLRSTYAWDIAGGWIISHNVSLGLHPTPSVLVRIEPGLRRSRDMAQYVEAVSDPAAARTYGSRYVFTTLDQTQLSLDTRLNWTFSPTLSLQFYAQPFVVAGLYRDIKGLRAPRTYQFDIYGRDAGTVSRDAGGVYTIDPDGAGASAPFTLSDPSFNFRSLLGNAVLRWEYRPGSAVFLVWQQTRTGSVSDGGFSFSRDVGSLLDYRPENTVVAKITYWIGV